MLDLQTLADLGRQSVAALWLPVALWTALALVAEAVLRGLRAPAALALPVRGAVLAALPLAVLVPAMTRALAPSAVQTVSAWTQDVVWLPGIVVGSAPVAPADPMGSPLLDVLLGLAVVAAAVLAAVHLARLVWSLAAITTLRRRLMPATPGAQASVDAARQRLGVARPVAAAVAPDGVAPFTVGWRRPVVALPGDLGDDACHVAALHEVAHVRRADYAWHLAQRATVAAFAAHPLAWVLGRGLDLDRERQADADVLAARPGLRRTYADLLFSYASRPAPALALGTVRGSSSLKHRIDAMTSPLSPAQSHRLGLFGRLGGLLVLLAVAVGVTAMTPPAPEPDAPLATATTAVERSPAAIGTEETAAARKLEAVGTDTTDVYNMVDEPPELIGGLEGLMDRLEYPELQRRAGVEGRAIIQFVVGTDGRVEEADVVRTAGNDGLDQAALQVVETARFTPGRNDGQAVRTRFALPISFRLSGSTTPTDSQARNERYPNARLTVSGLDPSQFGDDTALFDKMLVGSGQIVRENNPALPDGTQATVRFRLDDRGRLDSESVETVSANDTLGGMSRGLVGLLTYPAVPGLAGRSFELTTTYVRGD